jgi:DNA-directed RNA polymerase I subunit RPA1
VCVPPSAPRLLLLALAEGVAAETTLHAVPGVDRASVVRGRAPHGGAEVDAPFLVRTEGVNLAAAWEATVGGALGAGGGGAGEAAAGGVTTNCVGSALRALGVEAARATLVSEVMALFGAYGIGVDVRHMGLVADFMTHQGGHRPCNRLGIEASASPLLRVSFETAASFLAEATLRGEPDALRSPAARIVVGRPVGVGTGACELLQSM